jgi:hypothetical protein
MTNFWDIPPCNLIEVNRRFRPAFCPIIRVISTYSCLRRISTHHADDGGSTHLLNVNETNGAISQKAVVFIIVAVKTWYSNISPYITHIEIDYLSPWYKVFLQNLIVGKLVKERRLWNTKVQYCVRNSPRPGPIPSHMNRRPHTNVPIQSFHLLLVSPSCLFPWVWLTKLLCAFLISRAPYVQYSSHSLKFRHRNSHRNI